jgi:hypothetical protein
MKRSSAKIPVANSGRIGKSNRSRCAILDSTSPVEAHSPRLRILQRPPRAHPPYLSYNIGKLLEQAGSRSLEAAVHHCPLPVCKPQLDGAWPRLFWPVQLVIRSFTSS